MPLQRGTRIYGQIISCNSNDFNVVLPVSLKKIIVIQPGLLDELGWLPLFERRKHSRLTVFYKALNNLSAISLDHLLVSPQHTRASNEKKLCHCQFVLIFSNVHFFPWTISDWNSHWLFVSRSRLSPSTGLC